MILCWLDGVPCASCFMGILLPPESHFTFVRTRPEKWLSWSIPKEELLAQKIQPAAQPPRPFKTEKHIIRLPVTAASEFRSIAHNAFGKGTEYYSAVPD